MPTSPHLSVWRWHITMATSIFHRATGVALYVGALIAAGWAIALAQGPETYTRFKALLGSLPGKVVMFGLTVSIFYHLAAGLRHLVWDSGAGFEPRFANMTAVGAFAFAFVAAIVVWAIAIQTGAVR